MSAGTDRAAAALTALETAKKAFDAAKAEVDASLDAVKAEKTAIVEPSN